MLVAIFGVLRGASRLHKIDTILSWERERERERSRSEMLGRCIFGVLGNWSHLKITKHGNPNWKQKMLKTVVASNLGGFFNCQILKVRTYFYIMLE